MTAHSCSKCNYTTTRLFNLERHTHTRHKSETLQTTESSLKNQPTSLKTQPETLKNQPNTLNLSCEQCNRTFTRKDNLTTHMKSCNGIPKGCCEKCKQYFDNNNILCKHRKQCDGTVKTLVTNQQPVVNNISITYNIVDNSTNTNTVNVLPLPFPDEDDGSFDFVTQGITQSIMKHCVTASRAEVGFNRFMGAILDHTENKMVRKSNPNINYSKIHTGNNEWILAPDEDVFPLMTHHMTTAALAKLDEFNTSMKYVCSNFQRYVNTVNTDDECKEYNDTIQRLKLMVVNMTQKLEAAERQQRIVVKDL